MRSTSTRQGRRTSRTARTSTSSTSGCAGGRPVAPCRGGEKSSRLLPRRISECHETYTSTRLIHVAIAPRNDSSHSPPVAAMRDFDFEPLGAYRTCHSHITVLNPRAKKLCIIRFSVATRALYYARRAITCSENTKFLKTNENIVVKLYAVHPALREHCVIATCQVGKHKR